MRIGRLVITARLERRNHGPWLCPKCGVQHLVFYTCGKCGGPVGVFDKHGREKRLGRPKRGAA